MPKFTHLVLFSDFIWVEFVREAHLLWVLHWRVEVKVFTSAVMNLAPVEEIVLFSNNFMVVYPAVLVDTSP